jgi:CDP-glucose 4,6-dehydratase
MRYFLTGHTGFKGAWLSLWLHHLGHEVCGYALNPKSGGLFEQAEVRALLSSDHRGDIRDLTTLKSALAADQPDVVMHLAAQPLVRESYRTPRETFETNISGTMNVLESVDSTASVRAHLVVTTDKVYRNVNQRHGYVEGDALGGDDPYSASKAMADILTQSWVKSFRGPATAIARAGNVIGGGDVSNERLIPDIVMAVTSGQALKLRYPQAVRPWQHVLDCLNGYLMIVDYLLSEDCPSSTADAWNIGPSETSFVSVAEVAKMFSTYWRGSDASAALTQPELYEANLLTLNTQKARRELGWLDRLTTEEAIFWTADWYRKVHDGGDARQLAESQIQQFLRK